MDLNLKIIILLISSCYISPSEERHLDKNSSLQTVQATDSLKRDVSKLVENNKTEIAVSSRAVKNDPWQGYYDFLINEGSYKFWAVFQVATALVLIYSAAAAIYYAKYNFIQPDYEYDYFFGRSDSDASYSDTIFNNENGQLFQSIMDAISSKKYA